MIMQDEIHPQTPDNRKQPRNGLDRTIFKLAITKPVIHLSLGCHFFLNEVLMALMF